MAKDIECPRCHVINTNDAIAEAWNCGSLEVNNDAMEWDCTACKKPMTITVKVSYDYTTKESITEADKKYLELMEDR